MYLAVFEPDYPNFDSAILECHTTRAIFFIAPPSQAACVSIIYLPCPIRVQEKRLPMHTQLQASRAQPKKIMTT